MRKLAMAQARGGEPTTDLLTQKSNVRSNVPFEERRWTEAANLRHMLGKLRCEIQEPLVPRSHLPLGAVIVRFRHLRAAVWGTEPVEVNRTLRLNCRGSLRVEIDFRPRFFMAQEEPGSVQLDAAAAKEEDEYYAVRPLDESPEALMFAPIMDPAFEMERPPSMEQMMAMPGARSRRDPERMYRRFMQITHWSKKVMDIRNQLEAAEGERTEAQRRTEGKTVAQRMVDNVATRIQHVREARANRKDLLDRPMGSVTADPSAPPQAATTAAVVQPGAAARTGPYDHKTQRMKLPKLNAEPWLEELMETSRLL